MGRVLVYKSGITGSGSPNYLNQAQSLVIKGTTAYVVGGESYLSSFNVTNAYSGSITHTTQGQGGGLHPSGYFAGSSDWREYPITNPAGTYAYQVAYDSNSFAVFFDAGAFGYTLQGFISGAGAPNYLGGAMLVYLINERYAFVCSYTDGVISRWDLDLTVSPLVMTPLGTLSVSGTLFSIVPSGTQLIASSVAAGDDGLVRESTWDISDPSNPVYLSSTVLDADTIEEKRVASDGTNIWVGSPTLTKFDTDCAYLDGVRATKYPYSLNRCYDLIIDGDYLYYLSKILSTISIYDHTTLTHLATIRDSDNPSRKMTSPNAAAIEGNYLYIVCGGSSDDTLVIYDISDPSSPVYVNTIDWSDGFHIYYPLDVVVQDSVAYVINGSSSSSIRPWVAIDVSDPYNPVQIGRAQSGSGTGTRRAAISSDGKLLFTGSNSSLVAFDLESLSDATPFWDIETIVNVPNLFGVTDIVLANDMIFLTCESSDALLAFFLSTTATFTVDAIIQVGGTSTSEFTVDAIIQVGATRTSSFTVDAIIQTTNTATFTCDAIISSTDSLALSVLIIGTQEATFTADMLVFATEAATFTVDAYISSLSTFTVDAVIIAGIPNAEVMANFVPTTYLRGRINRR